MSTIATETAKVENAVARASDDAVEPRQTYFSLRSGADMRMELDTLIEFPEDFFALGFRPSQSGHEVWFYDFTGGARIALDWIAPGHALWNELAKPRVASDLRAVANLREAAEAARARVMLRIIGGWVAFRVERADGSITAAERGPAAGIGELRHYGDHTMLMNEEPPARTFAWEELLAALRV